MVAISKPQKGIGNTETLCAISAGGKSGLRPLGVNLDLDQVSAHLKPYLYENLIF